MAGEYGYRCLNEERIRTLVQNENTVMDQDDFHIQGWFGPGMESIKQKIFEKIQKMLTRKYKW